MNTLKVFAIKIAAYFITKRVYRNANKAVKIQHKTFQKLLKKASHTAFGKDHHFSEIKTYNDFKNKVPVRDYEGIKHYVERIIKGENDVLWKGKPLYFSKSSGTTSGVKYIPITKASMPSHLKSTQNALMLYVAATKKAQFLNGKLIFLQGSPILKEKGGVKTGRLSGIVAHYVPPYLTKNRLPSWETNCIENWEDKVDAIVKETLSENMTVIGGIPPWVQMYFEKLKDKSGKDIGTLFPNLELLIHGGVNFNPYKNAFKELLGKKIASIELYPASEGFIAYQDSLSEEGLLLAIDNQIFYEFIPVDEFHDENPMRISLEDVELNVNYVLILNTNAGLWGYNIGDTIKFVSLSPYRIIVTGRIKHFISAFGEHVIGKEVELALQEAVKDTSIIVNEFTVAPQVTPEEGLPYHEWFIEFKNKPENLDAIAKEMDRSLQEQNLYYKDLIDGKILQPLKITALKKGMFNAYMKKIGKLGGQNKPPRLCNDRSVADILTELNNA